MIEVKKNSSRLSTFVLIAEGIFLTVIALKSDLDYSMSWGFTLKRLYGYAVVFWTAGAYLMFFYNYIREHANYQFVKNAVVLAAFTLIAVNIANFDYLIYHNNKKTTTHAGLDYTYLSELSADSYSYKEMLEIEANAPKKDNKYSVVALRNTLNSIESLKQKYSHFDIRGFNMAEYLQYQQIKDVDLSKYQKLYQQRMDELYPPVIPEPYPQGEQQEYQKDQFTR
jgi:hypothetical protein